MTVMIARLFLVIGVFVLGSEARSFSPPPAPPSPPPSVVLVDYSSGANRLAPLAFAASVVVVTAFAGDSPFYYLYV